MTLLATIAAVVAAALPASPVATSPSQYCSRSGDVCFGIHRAQGGGIVFRIDTFERYFARYRLCVRPPKGAASCRTFSIRARSGIFGSSVRWARNFPRRGPGIYRVTWRQGAQRLGPTLSFPVTR